MSCGCEINLQRRLPGVIYQNSLPPSLSLSLQSKVFGAKVSRERERGELAKRIMRTVDEQQQQRQQLKKTSTINEIFC